MSHLGKPAASAKLVLLSVLVALQPAAAAGPGELHLLDSAIDIQLLGSLAGVRIVQTVRNAGPVTLDLGRHLPAIDEQVDRLTVTRDGRSIDLVSGDEAGCGDDDAHAGHVLAAFDEWTADVLGMAAGSDARVEVEAVLPVEGQSPVLRLALPPTVVPLEAQAGWIDTPHGRRLLVVLPADAHGNATLTLRPADRPALRLAVGPVDGLPTALLLAPGAGAAVELNAVELEIARPDRVVWTTLAVPRREVALAASNRRLD
jgi:hypothetical protein